MRYHHTQTGPIYLLLLAFAAGCLIAAWIVRADSIPSSILAAAAVLFAVFAFCFRDLTIEDAGESLAVRFGPLPIFGTRLRFDDITAVEPGRSALIDGLGIHYVPWRGWIYNLWGADCVVIRMGERHVRVGSDDVPALVAFLRERTRTA